MLVKRSQKILRDFNARLRKNHPPTNKNVKFNKDKKLLFIQQEKQTAKIFAAMISIKRTVIRGMLRHRLHF